jgi:hypothetical protein
MKNRERYNYRKITMLLDLAEKDDQKILAWLEKNKSKRNNLSVQLRNALKRVIELEE